MEEKYRVVCLFYVLSEKPTRTLLMGLMIITLTLNEKVEYSLNTYSFILAQLPKMGINFSYKDNTKLDSTRSFN